MAIQQIHTYCAMCTSRCGVLATVEDGVLKKVNADPDHPNGCICVKGTAAPEIVYSPDRLRFPMKRTRPKGEKDPGWARISWDEAMEITVAQLRDIKARYGPEAVVFSRATPAGSSSSDFEPWLRRLVNAFGSPNFMTTQHICNWHRMIGHQHTYGLGEPLPDYDNARCILLWGFNPNVSSPASAVRISRARAKGAKLIVIDPRKASVVDKADLWLRVRPGSDNTLALSMIHVLIDERLYDASFVREWTNGPFLVREDNGQLLTAQDLSQAVDSETFFVWDESDHGLVRYSVERGFDKDEPQAALHGSYSIALADGKLVQCRPAFDLLRELAAHYSPEEAEKQTWVPASDVRQAARMFATHKPSCYFTWVGLEQHADAMQTNRAVCVFFALTGQYDQRGSNVLFATTPNNPIMGQGLLPKEQAARRLGLRERPLGPSGLSGLVQPYEVYRAILSAQPYPVKALVTFGGDTLLGAGDPLQGKAALEALDFYLHMDMFANPSAACADLLLPASTCWEREALITSFDTAEDTKTWAQLRPMVVQPLQESRADLAVIFDLAKRLGLGEHFFDGNIEAAYNYQLAPSGFTVTQLRVHPMGMRYPAQTRYQKYAEIDAQTKRPRGFQTPTRKIEIFSNRFAKAGYAPLPVPQEIHDSKNGPGESANDYPLALTFFRLVQFCDEQHRNIPRLRRQAPEPFLQIHPSTSAPLGIQDGEWVILETAKGGVRLKAKLNAFLDPRVVATQYGWWQECQELGLPGYDPFGPNGANGNLLISNDAIDPISGSVPHRSQRCRVRKESVPAFSPA